MKGSFQFAFRIGTVPPPPSMAASDVALFNAATAETAFMLDFFIGASLGWLRANPGQTYQGLERVLRDKDFETHLIACKPRVTGATLRVPFTEGGLDCEYECITSCRPRELAQAELLKHADSYEQNFERLARAGTATVADNEALEHAPEVRVFSSDAQSLMDKLSRNEVLLIVQEIDMEEHLTELRATYPQVYAAVYGMHPEHGIVLACYTPQQGIVSSIGFLKRGDSTRAIKLEQE